MVPNGPIAADKTLRDFQVPIETLERHTGLLFFPLIRQTDVFERYDLCEHTTACESLFMTERQWECWNVYRRMTWAKTGEEVEAVWRDAEAKGLELDAETHALHATLMEKYAVNPATTLAPAPAPALAPAPAPASAAPEPSLPSST